jgi:peptide-methionine (S)-S-oxide reductase
MKSEIAVFGGGCFWCLEPIYNLVKGIYDVQVGYTGGDTENPTYEEVSSGTTGHAEVARIEFNPAEINYEQLLAIFFSIHDPTTINRQGSDIGEQYRSVIFYTDENQRLEAEKMIDDLKLKGIPVVTQLEPFQNFYPAEDYHQKYFEAHQDAPYCQIIISPKITKFREKFKELLK